ncbi:hypothetical protein HDU76_007823 [Blyttiomyces sp. JEL0837]|nr:hypothetical protein HDU76_007823 [Blyttiomyces sp. JEL0837]
MTCVSVAPAVQDANPKSGIAQAAMVVAYSTYLVGSALSSEPEGDEGNNVCNQVNESDSTRNTTIVLGTIFTFLALAYSASHAATQGNFMNNSDEASVPLMNDHVRGAVEAGALPASSIEDDNNEGPLDDEKEGVQYSYSVFHIVFLLASCYLSQLITNWDTVSIDTSKNAVVGKGWSAVWVKLGGIVAVRMDPDRTISSSGPGMVAEPSDIERTLLNSSDFRTNIPFEISWF